MEVKSQDVSVRAATAADADSLSKVAIAAVPMSCPPGTDQQAIETFIQENLLPEHFIEHTTISTRYLLVAVSGQEAVGFALLYEEEAPECITGSRSIELRRIYVHPEYHGAGAGPALMDSSIRHAESLGCDAIWLGVSEANQRAQRFYEKNGFLKVGEHFFQVGHEQQLDYLLAKRLGDSI
jgi:ribosomal protein S18 acetylase RimI-like enzyme